MRVKQSIWSICSVLVLVTTSAMAKEAAITNNLHSPHVKLRSINIGDATWTDGFWADKYRQAEQIMIPNMGELLKGDIGHGYNNFKIAAGLKEGDAKGFPFHDGDFYKWMESTMYLYANNQDPKLLSQLDEIIGVIGKAQQDNGYLHTHNQIKKRKPWTWRNHHELYNYGHLFTAAIIHHRTTGQKNFLNIAIKSADYLYDLFMPQPKYLARFGFNQTQITGLVELYREVKDRRYLELAELFINMRGAKGVKIKPDDMVSPSQIGAMVQERVPLRNAKEAVGHAVLAMYYYAGAADVYAETGEKALLDALKRLWSSADERKMYITGALGQTHHGAKGHDAIHEGFLDDYMMPNATAYNEVCANITNAMFNWRMLGLTGESKHADVMETVIYNSMLSGISADGKHYFYTNPLRRSHGLGTTVFGKEDTATSNREDYLNCFCCPPNLVRTLAKLSGWAYSLSDNGLAVNIYGGNTLNTTLLDGSAIKLKQVTNYPWEGTIAITVEQAKSSPFEVKLRIPAWASTADIKVNGVNADVTITPGQYATIQRSWASGDVITLALPLKVEMMEGNTLIEEVRNQVAIQRGPIVYVTETPDIPDNGSVLDVYISSTAEFEPEYKPTLLNGLTVLNGELLLRSKGPKNMYGKVGKPIFTPFKTQLIPYYAWSNRSDATEMTVFMPVVWEEEKSAWWKF